ncbi:MAG: amidohydrolase family protein [Bryobacteraceae bacterium]|nr:amidohydrolase family protein [Bryobacteraceae bacterium]
MKSNLLVRGARQLLTLHGQGSGPRRGDTLQDLGVIEDGSVLVVNGVIASVGPTRRIENLAEAKSAREISAAGRVVLPGFVDTHTQILGLPGRLLPHRPNDRRTEQSARFVAPSELAATVQYLRNTPGAALEFYAAKQIESFLRHGTTTMEVKTGYGLAASAELKMLRVLSKVNDRCVSVISSFVAGQAISAEHTEIPEYVNWLKEDILPRLSEKGLSRFAEVACGPGALHFKEASEVVDAAKRNGLPVKVQPAGDNMNEAIALAVASDAVSIGGTPSMTDAQAEALGRTRAITTLLPCSQLGGSYRARTVRNLIEAGGAIALGSGFEPSLCSTVSMQMVMAMACLQLNLTPEESICASTINGAHALGTAGRCGSLEFGKDADVCILGVSDYREIPLYYGGNLVAAVIRKGVLAYEEGAISCGNA